MTFEEAISIRTWTQRSVIALILVSTLGVLAWMNRPQPEPVSVLPPLPTLLTSPGVTVHFSDALFRSTAAVRTVTPAQADVAASAAAQWTVKGIDLGPPPRAYLSEVGGTRSVWVSVGDRAGAFTIKHIEAGQVVIDGADGESILRF